MLAEVELVVCAPHSGFHQMPLSTAQETMETIRVVMEGSGGGERHDATSTFALEAVRTTLTMFTKHVCGELPGRRKRTIVEPDVPKLPVAQIALDTSVGKRKATLDTSVAGNAAG